MLGGIVTYGCAERSHRHAGGNVHAAQLAHGSGRQTHSNAVAIPFDDERVAIEPEAIREIRHERRDGCTHAAARHVRADVRGERASVDDDGDGRARWE
jgi:hypothetical protein